MVNKLVLFIAVLGLVCVLIVVFVPALTHVDLEEEGIVTFSIIIEKPEYFDELSAWLDDLNYTHFTFAIRDVSEDYILDNSTRINKLEQYGKIIPEISYIQKNAPEARGVLIDECINRYSQSVGYAPKGIMSFQPDTYICNYLLNEGLIYVQGYCFDQYAIDLMTMRGAFQMPYYANPLNVLIPNNKTEGGMIILPHSTWDWIESFRVSHEMHLHPQNLISQIFHGHVSAAEEYFLQLIDSSIAGSRPFGLAVCQFEWAWCYSWGYSDEAKHWIKRITATRPYQFWDFETIANWFKTNYSHTPTYEINFASPYSNEKIEWYYDIKSRVARIGDEVVSYVDYTMQPMDRYLVQAGFIDWFAPRTESNCIDNSLRFDIDALGGGYGRAPIETNTYHYSGELSNFPYQYASPR
jgi:hypothetical protein